jgi:hypothetical protein
MLEVTKGMVWTKIKNASLLPIEIIVKGKGNAVLYPGETINILNTEKWTSKKLD